MSLLAEIDGVAVPLEKCDWIFLEPCGVHFSGVLVAAIGDSVFAATEDMAWREMYDTKREVEREKKTGRTLRLVTHEWYKANYKTLFTECDCRVPAEQVEGQAALFGGAAV